MLSVARGAVGIDCGWLASSIFSNLDLDGTKIPATVFPNIVMPAPSVSIFIGLVSGIYPAMHAACPNPIEAPHYGG